MKTTHAWLLIYLSNEADIQSISLLWHLQGCLLLAENPELSERDMSESELQQYITYDPREVAAKRQQLRRNHPDS